MNIKLIAGIKEAELDTYTVEVIQELFKVNNLWGPDAPKKSLDMFEAITVKNRKILEHVEIMARYAR